MRAAKIAVPAAHHIILDWIRDQYDTRTDVPYNDTRTDVSYNNEGERNRASFHPIPCHSTKSEKNKGIERPSIQSHVYPSKAWSERVIPGSDPESRVFSREDAALCFLPVILVPDDPRLEI